ncbi:Acetyltransferase (GNAT) family protein [Asanoa hainanensis]|uniref:Acetyltransferase (GNAT) family protein n=1 Tax=Asanoa hainanensis TaxID=560556 RepID=A0A239LFQ9_9ACTN|nr:GNAT family N-acetyltransferase [Asanoa hainanensis]SNT28479.1 Acetyltransferase (GNAT) family protein [Asanoa hainanensis]
MDARRVRRADAGDGPDLARLLSAFLDAGTDERGHSLDAVLASADHVVFVAVSDDELVGFVTASYRRVAREPHPICEIDELYVSPHDRRGGLASRLVDAVAEDARSRRCARLFVASNNKRRDGHAFYARVGFDPYGGHFRVKL